MTPTVPSVASDWLSFPRGQIFLEIKRGNWKGEATLVWRLRYGYNEHYGATISNGSSPFSEAHLKYFPGDFILVMPGTIHSLSWAEAERLRNALGILVVYEPVEQEP